jgi:hypothetical protein
MSNQFNDIQEINEGMAITPTGESKLNARVDEAEYARRGVINDGSQANQVATVFQRELMFARINRKHSAAIRVGEQDSHTLVFGSFNGITHHDESEFRFVGVSCNSPEHQGRNGPLGNQFALQVDGTTTILCLSAISIPKNATIAWRIPRGPDFLGDPKGAGRLLAELYEYKPSEDMIRPHNLHSMLHRVLAGGEKLSDHDQARSMMPIKLWECLLSIGYTLTIAFMEADNPGPALVRVSDDNKLRIAEVFGLITPTGYTNAAVKAEQEKRHANFATHALDMLFQMQYNSTKKTSNGDESARVFPLRAAGAGPMADGRKQEVAQKQAGQVASLVNLMIAWYDKEQRKIIGYTPTGGFKGFSMDVVLRRQ